MMDIDEAKAIYWQMENCYEADCLCDDEMECITCDYFVTEKRYIEALLILAFAGLIDDEGELI